MSQIKNERKVLTWQTLIRCVLNQAIFSFVTIRYSKLDATALLWSTQTSWRKHSLQCSVTKCLRFTCHKTASIYSRSFAFRNFFLHSELCSSWANVSLGVLNPSQDNSVYSPQSLFLLISLCLLKKCYKPVSITFPDFQGQMEWCQRYFTKMSLKPQSRRQDFATGDRGRGTIFK